MKLFDRLGISLSAWDDAILKCGDQIVQLHVDVDDLEKQGHELDSKLESIAQQQQELKEAFALIETELGAQPPLQMTPPDFERQSTTQLAIHMNQHLNQMQRQIQQMIGKLNDSFEKAHTADAENPLNTIVRILNVHLLSLQWIDDNTPRLQSAVERAQGAILRAEHDLVTRR